MFHVVRFVHGGNSCASLWAIEMDGDCRSKSRKVLAGLCWVQAGAATAAAIAAGVQVESIVGFCPAIAVLGLVLAFVSLKNTCLNLLLFGLSCPLATSVIALLIASLSWLPDEAAKPVLAILTLHAGVTVVWGAFTARQISRSRSWGASAERSGFRFSLLGLFGLVTLACILFAVFRQLSGSSDMVAFAVYGSSVLALSLALCIAFWNRVQRDIREEDGERHTVIHDESVRPPARPGRTAVSPSA